MKKITTFALSVFSFLGILKIFSIVPFNRMAADDFGYTNVVTQMGFWKAQINWYTNWTGRFTSTFLQTLFGTNMGSDGKAIIYSIVTIAVLLLAFLVFYSRFLGLKLTDFKVILLSCVSVSALYVLTLNKKEDWYWMAGSVTYLWPIIFLIFGSSYLFIKKPKKIEYLLVFILMFFSGGGNETFALLTCLSLAVFIAYSLITKYFNKTLLTMFVASVLSFFVVYLSPGNLTRSSGVASDPMSVMGSLMYALQTGPGYLFTIVWNNSFILISLSVCLAILFSTILKRQDLNLEDYFKKMFVLFTAPIFLSILYMFPGFKVLGRISPDRSDITLVFIVLSALLFASFYTGQILISLSLESKVVVEVVVLIFSAALFVSSFNIMSTFASDFYIAKNYSDAFDRVIVRLKKASSSGEEGTIVVEKLPESGLIGSADLKGYPSYEKNYVVAKYYGLDAIIAK